MNSTTEQVAEHLNKFMTAEEHVSVCMQTACNENCLDQLSSAELGTEMTMNS